MIIIIIIIGESRGRRVGEPKKNGKKPRRENSKNNINGIKEKMNSK